MVRSQKNCLVAPFVALRRGDPQRGAFNGAVINLVAGKAPIRALIGYYGVDELRQTSFFTLEGSPIASARDLIGKNFVQAVARAIEWARQTPREEVIARFTSIIAGRGGDEDASVLKYWKSYGVAGQGGVIAEREFQIWLDWMVKDGSLKPGQLSVDDIYDNRFNPFAVEAAASPTAVPQR